MTNKNILYYGAAERVLEKIPSDSIDFILTSPPYDQIRDYLENDHWTNLGKIGKECYRVLKNGGVAVMVIQDQQKNYKKSLTSFRTILNWCDNAGFSLFECAIYSKNGIPGGQYKRAFRIDHEYIPIFVKGDKPAYFNKDHMMVPCKHYGSKKNNAPVSRRQKDGTLTRYNIHKDTPAHKCGGTIWRFTNTYRGNKTKHKHPAVFPDKLAHDIIKIFCKKGGLVLDPMCGSGTTLVQAKKLGMNYIGIDVSGKYLDIARELLV